MAHKDHKLKNIVTVTNLLSIFYRFQNSLDKCCTFLSDIIHDFQLHCIQRHPFCLVQNSLCLCSSLRLHLRCASHSFTGLIVCYKKTRLSIPPSFFEPEQFRVTVVPLDLCHGARSLKVCTLSQSETVTEIYIGKKLQHLAKMYSALLGKQLPLN